MGHSPWNCDISKSRSVVAKAEAYGVEFGVTKATILAMLLDLLVIAKQILTSKGAIAFCFVKFQKKKGTP